MDVENAMAVAAAVSAVGLAWNGADLWYPSRAFNAFFDWRIVGGAWAVPRRGGPRKWQRLLAGHAAVRVFVLTQVIGALTFVVAASTGRTLVALVAATSVFAALCLLQFRLVVGLDGSDQIQIILWATLAILSVNGPPALSTIALAFLTAQLVASYLVAGIAKLGASSWRSGEAVHAILATRQYGLPIVRKLLRRKGIALTMAWSVIVFEVLGPLALLAGRTGTLGFLAAALGFHLINWGVMGLRSFALAFPATYPLVFAFVDGWAWP